MGSRRAISERVLVLMTDQKLFRQQRYFNDSVLYSDHIEGSLELQ